MGRNRSATFGRELLDLFEVGDRNNARYNLLAETVFGSKITEAVEGTKEILRHLIIRLTKVEEANPFLFHPSVADRKVETIIVEEEVVEQPTDETTTEETDEVVKDGEAEEETV